MICASNTFQELNIRGNQFVDLPPSMANLQKLQILDLEGNQFNSPNYKTDDISQFLGFIGFKVVFISLTLF